MLRIDKEKIVVNLKYVRNAWNLYQLNKENEYFVNKNIIQKIINQKKKGRRRRSSNSLILIKLIIWKKTLKRAVLLPLKIMLLK
jgi:hypothetical protein